MRSLQVLVRFKDKVTVVSGAENLGPAGNRNRILPHLRQNDYLCFIDADMEVLSGSFRKQALAIFEEEKTVGIIGGLIFNRDNLPMPFKLWSLFEHRTRYCRRVFREISNDPASAQACYQTISSTVYR